MDKGTRYRGTNNLRDKRQGDKVQGKRVKGQCSGRQGTRGQDTGGPFKFLFKDFARKD